MKSVSKIVFVAVGLVLVLASLMGLILPVQLLHDASLTH